MKPVASDERWTSLLALLATLAILLSLGAVLLHVPAPSPLVSAARDSSMQVSLIPREPKPEQALPRLPVQQRKPADALPQALQPRPAASRAIEPPPSATQAAPVAEAKLYARDGRVRMGELVNPLDSGKPVEPGSPTQRQLAEAKRIMDPPNPIDYQETRFEKDWASDGSLGQAMGQAITRGTRKLSTLMNGEEPQVAKPRPPPNLAFNPALAANQADLGSEATGDAYKAAPIAHQDVPDSVGGASRRIADQLTILKAQASACEKPRLQQLLAPVNTHLADLQRAEHALNHGADPTMAKGLLPQQMDSAYDLARRALWYARKQLGSCVAG